MDLDVHSLTNEQLKSVLIKLGVKPGPIVGTTRRVYENQLIKLLATEEAASVLMNDLSSQTSPVMTNQRFSPQQPNLRNTPNDDDVVILNGAVYSTPTDNQMWSKRRTPTPPRHHDSSPVRSTMMGVSGGARIGFSPPKPAVEPTAISSPPPLTSFLGSQMQQQHQSRRTEYDGGRNYPEDRMEGEERIRFVAPPTFEDDQSTTQIRQRVNANAGHTPKLYPNLNAATDSGNERDYVRYERGFGSSNNGAAAAKTGLSPRTALPRDLYGKETVASVRAGLPIWLKVIACFLITVFAVMFVKRLMEGDEPQTTKEFDE